MSLIAYSFKNSIGIIFALLGIQVRVLIFYFQTSDILQNQETLQYEVTFVAYLTLLAIMNLSLFINLLDDHRIKAMILNILIINLGLLNQFYGLKNLEAAPFIFVSLSIPLISVYYYVNRDMTNLALYIAIQAFKNQEQLKDNKIFQREIITILNELQEGILIISKGAISFKNKMVNKILGDDNLMNLRVF